MELSVVVPLYNERDNLAPLHEELARVLGATGGSYEMLFVDDGSTDGGADVLRAIKAADAHVRVIRLARNSGQTAALACGLHHAAGDVVVAIDGDGENDPGDIPRLLARLAEGFDLVSGWRTERWTGARLSRRLPSVAANRLISWMTGVRLHDYGCTLKAYRRDLARRLMLYGEMHRFVPAIAAEQGARIAEIEVNFRPRRAGASTSSWQWHSAAISIGELNLVTTRACAPTDAKACSRDMSVGMSNTIRLEMARPISLATRA